jgi:hypothetical protein
VITLINSFRSAAKTKGRNHDKNDIWEFRSDANEFIASETGNCCGTERRNAEKIDIVQFRLHVLGIQRCLECKSSKHSRN